MHQDCPLLSAFAALLPIQPPTVQELAKAGIDRKDVFITTKRRVVNPTVKGNALATSVGLARDLCHLV